MGKGSENTLTTIESTTSCSDQKKVFTWNQIKSHNKRDNLWIVINKNVYDLTSFQKKHPGGSRVLNMYGGEDATEAFTAFHKDEDKLKKYMKVYCIGELEDNLPLGSIDIKEGEVSEIDARKRKERLKRDFEQLRQAAIEMKLFDSSAWFFGLQALQIVFFHILGYFILIKYGAGFFSYTTALFCHIIAQGQAAWSQHDYGHLSVFKNSKVNRVGHWFLMSLIKGASQNWWNHMHNQHHAKPNVINKDPDVRIDPLFVLGKVQPIRTAQKNAKDKSTIVVNYLNQHKYFFLAAPLLFPAYFQLMTFRHAYKRKLYTDLLLMSTMFSIHFGITISILGLFGSFAYFLIMRLFESAWFTWVAQSNHIVMDIHDEDEQDTWLTLQLKATCNIEKSFFNDWFTGHLNMQVEHHLFPTMPRHNLYKIQPLVQSLCKRYGINYVTKPLGEAFRDIVFSLEKSGKMWHEAYEEIIQAM